jgi:hypothetical protein
MKQSVDMQSKRSVAKHSLHTLVILMLALLSLLTWRTAYVSNQRITRLQTSGVTLTARVTSCEGQIGGSGSNAAGYTCTVHYELRGKGFTEKLGESNVGFAPGTTIAVVLLPSQPSSVTSTVALSNERASDDHYLIPFLIAFADLSYVLYLLRSRTKTRQR